MKVLILSNFGAGLFKFRLELIKRLISENYEVILAYPADEYVPKFEELGCRFINTNLDRRGINPVKDFFLFIEYIKHIRKIKPAIVLTYTIKPNVYGGLSCQLTKTPYIVTITGLGSAIENEGILKKVSLFLYKAALRSANYVFFQNDKNRTLFHEHNIVKGETQVIPGSGVNITKFIYEPYPESNKTLNLVFIGRIMRDKGINELFATIPIIKKKYAHVNFSLIGFCEEDYESQIEEMESGNLLTFHGKTDDVIPYLKQAHAIVLPSYHEGMSNVLLEAAAMGRPVLASNIPGCKETFDDNISGIAFNSKDTDSLVAAIDKFVNMTHEERSRMGYNGRKKVEQQFDRNIVVSKYINEIKKVGN